MLRSAVTFSSSSRSCRTIGSVLGSMVGASVIYAFTSAFCHSTASPSPTKSASISLIIFSLSLSHVHKPVFALWVITEPLTPNNFQRLSAILAKASRLPLRHIICMCTAVPHPVHCTHNGTRFAGCRTLIFRFTIVAVHLIHPHFIACPHCPQNSFRFPSPLYRYSPLPQAGQASMCLSPSG